MKKTVKSRASISHKKSPSLKTKVARKGKASGKTRGFSEQKDDRDYNIKASDSSEVNQYGGNGRFTSRVISRTDDEVESPHSILLEARPRSYTTSRGR